MLLHTISCCTAELELKETGQSDQTTLCQILINHINALCLYLLLHVFLCVFMLFLTLFYES